MVIPGMSAAVPLEADSLVARFSTRFVSRLAAVDEPFTPEMQQSSFRALGAALFSQHRALAPCLPGFT